MKTCVTLYLYQKNRPFLNESVTKMTARIKTDDDAPVLTISDLNDALTFGEVINIEDSENGLIATLKFPPAPATFNEKSVYIDGTPARNISQVLNYLEDNFDRSLIEYFDGEEFHQWF